MADWRLDRLADGPLCQVRQNGEGEEEVVSHPAMAGKGAELMRTRTGGTASSARDATQNHPRTKKIRKTDVEDHSIRGKIDFLPSNPANSHTFNVWLPTVSNSSMPETPKGAETRGRERLRRRKKKKQRRAKHIPLTRIEECHHPSIACLRYHHHHSTTSSSIIGPPTPSGADKKQPYRPKQNLTRPPSGLGHHRCCWRD